MTRSPLAGSPSDPTARTVPVRGVVVWTMPKVGSTTVQRSLERGVPGLRVCKAHVLSPEGYATACRSHEKRGVPIPDFLAKSAEIRRQMQAAAPSEWKIITLVRDPLALHISAFFHHAQDRHPAALERALAGDTTQLLEQLMRLLAEFPAKSTRFAAEWFERELRGWLGIDALAQPFDPARGFGVLPHPRTDVLVLRLEDLDRCFNEALVPFLGLPGPVPVVRANSGSDRASADAYRAVLEKLAVPIEICRRFYDTPLARHFYSDEERARFTARWSRS